MIKPLMPRKLYYEKRLIDIKEASNTYFESNKEIPLEWIQEYNNLLETIKKIKDDS